MLHKNILCFSWILLIFIGCKKEKQAQQVLSKNQVKYAKGFSIENFNKFSLIKVSNPWPNAIKKYTYVLTKNPSTIPDSLRQFTIVKIPVKRIVVTSTTHIPSLEMLHEENTLIGFPNFDYISSDKIWKRIDAKKMKDLGENQAMNTEVLLQLNPDVIIGYGIDNSNPTLENLEKAGLKIMLNGDWNEQTPLGKAEWIKFFGALYDKQKEANRLFSKIENDYLKTKKLAQRAVKKPTVLAGDLYENKWNLPKGDSWAGVILKDAQANYLWKEEAGTGSLSLSFETVFTKAKNADFWFTSGQYCTLETMEKASPHYAQFMAFKNKNVYSFCHKKGRNGGALFYELAPNRPDIVLKDLVKILHPELLQGYNPFFYKKIN